MTAHGQKDADIARELLVQLCTQANTQTVPGELVIQMAQVHALLAIHSAITGQAA